MINKELIKYDFTIMEIILLYILLIYLIIYLLID